jgi:Heparinase II/III-like protein/Heparinase II/III N-terminus
MTPSEVGGRLEDRWHQSVWTARHAKGHYEAEVARAPKQPALAGPSVHGVLDALAPGIRSDLLKTADQILDGKWEILGIVREDLNAPDWFFDPLSGRSYAKDLCAFSIDFRDPNDDRRVKQVWELSRHHQLTVLAAAWQVTKDDRYAQAVDRSLRSWWDENPPVTGINWTSGIELGIRLISWVWVRRLLNEWPGAPALFEENVDALRQVFWHQKYLATFPSRGSSANNHVIAEAAGQVVAGCAFPWFAESAKWRDDAISLLESELLLNTFPSGLNREQAFEYHGLVAELGIIAAAEAVATDHNFSSKTIDLLGRMLDALAAVVDVQNRPPRYGDGDDGRALLLAAPNTDRWASLLAIGEAVFGGKDWWPPFTPDAAALLLGAMAQGKLAHESLSSQRPSSFSDAGLTILRSSGPDEVWCRCDGGPHGFLGIAAHAHADALSVEVRHGGVDVLADPGTYCYQGDPAWREYFRSTLAHNTVQIDGLDQSVSKGPFLWARKAGTEVLEVRVDGQTDLQSWTARHDGYRRLTDPLGHQRSVTLDAATKRLEFLDELESAGTHSVTMSFHLGPSIRCTLTGSEATLNWTGLDGHDHGATMQLPPGLMWSSVTGSTAPILGWYSASFGHKAPATTLIGQGACSTATFRTVLQFT